MSPSATGQPRRSASIARATSRARRIRSANSVTSGTWSDGRSQLRQGSWTRCAHRLASRPRRSPTYGRAAGRGRSSSSRASDSSTRCAAAAAPGGNGGRDRPSRCSSCSRVSASTSIGVWLTTLSSCLWLQTSHSSGATLKSPTMIVGRSQRLGPARHPLDEVELLAELRVLRRGRECRRRPARRHSPAGPRSPAARRHAAPRHWPASRGGRSSRSGSLRDDGDAMMHRLAADDDDGRSRAGGTARAGNSLSRTLVSCRHRMSGASSVRNFSTIASARAHGIDVPGRDLQRGGHG